MPVIILLKYIDILPCNVKQDSFIAIKFRVNGPGNWLKGIELHGQKPTYPKHPCIEQNNASAFKLHTKINTFVLSNVIHGD